LNAFSRIIYNSLPVTFIIQVFCQQCKDWELHYMQKFCFCPFEWMLQTDIILVLWFPWWVMALMMTVKFIIPWKHRKSSENTRACACVCVCMCMHVCVCVCDNLSVFKLLLVITFIFSSKTRIWTCITVTVTLFKINNGIYIIYYSFWVFSTYMCVCVRACACVHQRVG
jgi:hypothetical protein